MVQNFNQDSLILPTPSKTSGEEKEERLRSLTYRFAALFNEFHLSLRPPVNIALETIVRHFHGRPI